ncbi:DNA-binding transcriptional regulator, AcrR family [Mycolicibacterium rutilum]|uniref:DNA-binding transcriptional regulator, AcrR family n=1 Tax=Mycolicibacterium rutilum TaxID=370526 RepID=A0A1H6K746_MYCRU|nr:TetR/AcrR family transcriptional regulator [Mycolicibacterium rutilum]SEH67276.1 DNA-binding transcriptional regulator, AcrR family [Mycolicibacterium rutilum]
MARAVVDDEPRMTPGARRILEVATRLFYRDGIHAVGVDTIAAESGVTKRTLYDRFGSKDTLVAAYLRRRHQVWWERFERRIDEADPPRALVVFDAYLDDSTMVSRGCAFVNAAAELPRDHAAYAVIREHKQAVRERLAELVAEDVDDAAEARDIAEHLFLLAEGAIVHHGLDDSRDAMAAARRIATELLPRTKSRRRRPR